MGQSYSDTLEMKEYVNKRFLEVKDVWGVVSTSQARDMAILNSIIKRLSEREIEIRVQG